MRPNNKDEAAGLPGYGGYSFHDEDTYKSITLILPSAVVQSLKDEALAATLAQEAKESAEQQASKRAEDDRLSTALKPRPSLGSGDLDPDREAADLQQAALVSTETPCAEESIAVYGVLEPLILIKDLKARTPDREIHKRNEALYRRIKPKGHRRALAQPQVDPLRFDHLRRAFPHFSPVLDLVQDQHAFAELTGKRQRLSAQMPRTTFDRLMSCAVSTLKISARPNSPGLICCGGVFGTQERLEHQRNRPAHDGHVGNVEGRPVPAAQVEVEVVDDVPAYGAVESVAQSPAQDETVRKAFKFAQRTQQ